MPRVEQTESRTDYYWESVYLREDVFHYYDMSQPHPDLPGVIEKFRGRKIRKLLDIGAGLGGNLFSLHENGFDVRGIDSSPTAIMKLKKQISARGITLPIEQGEFERLPYSDGAFDGAICIQTLSHGLKENIEDGFAELARVVRSGGMIFITVPGRTAKGEIRYCLVKTADRVDDRVYVPTNGSEVGIPHYIFNMKLIRTHLTGFKIESTWRDYLGYYAVLAKRE